jgi:hypothetical protein
MQATLREYFGMATRKRKTRLARNGSEIRLRGKRIATLDERLTIVRTGDSVTEGVGRTRPADRAEAMLRKTGRALNKPGISKRSIFTNNSNGIFAYSADPSDATKLVRTSRDGTRRKGRVVGGKFKAT